jgi:hypothetical protein
MPRGKKFTAEQIIGKPRSASAIALASTIAEIVSVEPRTKASPWSPVRSLPKSLVPESRYG